MKAISYINNESGMALVIALVILLALTVIGISSLTTSTLDIQLSGNERRAAEALNLADAGIERALHDLLYDYKHDPSSSWSNNSLYRLSLENGDQVTDAIAAAAGNFGCTPKPSCIDTQFGDPFGAADLGGSTGNSVDVYGVNSDLANGKYRVLVLRDSSEPDEVYVRSYSEHSTGARKILQLHLGLNKVDAWRNALFAGRGSATAAITGNISVAGSIHILGTGAQNDMTISGSSAVKNGYKDLAEDIKRRLLLGAGTDCTGCGLEVLGTYDGKDVYSLETVVRIKNVQTAVTGSGNIGEAEGSTDTEGDDDVLNEIYDVVDNSGDGYDNLYYDPYLDVYFKSSIDAVYTNLSIDLSDPNKQMFSDTPESEYDLGDKIQMPRLEDPYDPATHVDRNGQTCDDRGVTCSNYKQYVEAISTEFDASTLLDTDGASASCRLTTSAITGSTNPTANFAYGDMDCGDANDVTSCTCNDADGCIKWVNNPGTDAGEQKPHLWVEGRVEIKGCPSGLTLSSGTPVTYTGKGIIYTSNNITIEKSLVSYGANQFLEGDLLAVMTPGNLRLAVNTQQSYMGAFYAGGTLGTDFPGVIVGALMGNLFCMSTDVNLTTGACVRENAASGNAADIYYTPGISEELTKLGMLKGRQVFTFDVYDWQQIY